ncbi:MAG: MBOAT family protein [Coriobacteriia bacterium]|nr:MBOAT family protein [Coriobacteriia bacterium]
MFFDSFVFLCVFLPLVVLLYVVTPSTRARNALLICASFLFYAYGEPVFIALMFASTVFNYLLGLLIGKARRDSRPVLAKGSLALAVIVNVAVLGVCKYSIMFTETFNHLVGTSWSTPAILLPLGISFFTFQAISYVVDVYRGTIGATRNFGHVCLHIAFFPRIIAGPIVRFDQIAPQLTVRPLRSPEMARGFRRFITGLGKKVLIASTLGLAVDALFAAPSEHIGALGAWIAAIAFLLQIFYDFSGYTDMAIGLGLMFGFTFPENFNYPYGSRGIQEFWRRWHMTLGAWFRDYLYIPLGGNRQGKLKTACNKLFVFFCTGLWHGANWTFVVWGMLQGFCVVLEDYVPFKKLPRLLQHGYALLLITIGFVIFRADTLTQAWHFITQMFVGWHQSAAALSLAFEQFDPLFVATITVALIGLLPLRVWAKRMLSDERFSCFPQLSCRPSILKAATFASYALSLMLLMLCLLALSAMTYSPFIYARF